MNKVISALFLSLSPITRKVLVATITLICLAVPAITTVSLIYWLRPWRLVETLWLLGIGLMIATLLSIRLSQRRFLLITSWMISLACGIVIGWYFYELRVQPVWPALNLGQPELSQVKQAYDRGELRQVRRELFSYFQSRPAKDTHPFFPKQTNDEIIQISDAQLKGMFALGEFPPVQYPPVQIPVDPSWSENPFKQLDWQYYLHAMDYVKALVECYQSTEDIRYLQRAEDLIFSWIKHNHHYFFYPPSSFSWHDAAIAHRVRSWLDFWETWIKSPLANEGKAETLLESIIYHARRLADPVYYYRAHNHGIDQDFGLLAVATIFPELQESRNWLVTAKERLKQQIIETISPRGVHREHSPEYQLYVMELLSEIHEFSLKHQITMINEIRIEDLLPKMASFAAYLIQPDGTLPALGDTMPGIIVDEHHPALERFVEHDPVLRYALSRGKSGNAGSNLVVYDQEGYVIFRDTWPSDGDFKKEIYLLFTAVPYPKLGHKQWDDLSFILSAGGRQLLVDPGLYSYDELSKERKYVVSTAAHNTVMVDAASFIGDMTRIESYFASERYWAVRAYHDNYPACSHASCCWECIRTSHDNYPGLRHQRTLLYVRPATVFVIDELTNREPKHQEAVQHKFEQLFHLAPSLKPRVDPSGASVAIYTSDSDELVLRIEQSAAGQSTAEVIVGQNDPMQGWVTADYNKLIAAPVVRFTATGDNALFVTQILVDSGQRLSAGGQQVPLHHQSQVSEDQISLAWNNSGIRWHATINRVGPLTVRVWQDE